MGSTSVYQQTSTKFIQKLPWDETRTNRELINDAIRNRSVSDAKAITDFGIATETEKISLIDILSHQGWVGPNDETQIQRLWNSFGRGISQVMERNAGLWTHCLSVGAELGNIQAVRNLRTEFIRDVHIKAAGYLAGNYTVTNQEMRQFGINEEENQADAPITASQETRLQEMQQAARIVAQMQRGQEDTTRILVGYDIRPSLMEYDPGGTYAVRFDPVQRPAMPPNANDSSMRDRKSVV